MIEMHEVGAKMKRLASLHLEHQERLEVEVVEDLEEYSSIVHTLPILIKMHEEAMASFNECKQKASVSFLPPPLSSSFLSPPFPLSLNYCFL